MQNPSRRGLGALAVLFGASALLLVIAAPGLARLQTTNTPAMVMVKVTLSEKTITLNPKQVPRGSTAIFLITNRTSTLRTMTIGDTERGQGKKIGFAVKLQPNREARVAMFLDYRGTLRVSTPRASGVRPSTTFRIS